MGFACSFGTFSQISGTDTGTLTCYTWYARSRAFKDNWIYRNTFEASAVNPAGAFLLPKNAGFSEQFTLHGARNEFSKPVLRPLSMSRSIWNETRSFQIWSEEIINERIYKFYDKNKDTITSYDNVTEEEFDTLQCCWFLCLASNRSDWLSLDCPL